MRSQALHRGTRLADVPSVRSLALLLLLSGSGVAAAQPVMPSAPPPSAPPPSGPPPIAQPPWSPIDDEGWPRGVSLESMRGLRPCDFGEQLPGPGQVIECRPQLHVEQPQWRLQVDWTNGMSFGDAPTRGNVRGFGADLDFTFGRRLALGARYELLGIGLQPAVTRDVWRSQRFFGQVRYRAFTDEVDRDAFTLVAGAGVALQSDGLGGDGLVARAGIAREVGLYLDDENAMIAALEVAYARSFGEVPVDTLTASLRFGFELNIAEPANLDSFDDPPDGRLWTGFDLWGSPFLLGIGGTLGYRLLDHVHAVSTTSYAYTFRRDQRAAADIPVDAIWATQAGLRVDAGWPKQGGPLYLQAQVGPARIATDTGPRGALLADGEFGWMFGVCPGMLAVGVRVRTELEDELDFVSAGLVMRFGIGGGAPPAGQRCGGERAAPTMPTEPIAYVPPPPPPPRPVYVAPPPVVVGGELGGRVEAGGRVEVVVTPPRPIVIDVTIGAALLGGLVQVRIDPRLLPLDRLRGVDFDVRLEGPANLLPSGQAELRAVFGRERIAVGGWAGVATGSAELHAIFTIYPPGTR